MSSVRELTSGTCVAWPLPADASCAATGGRGLQVVHELSGGRWGHHRCQARLGQPKDQGKAVWFALPAPPEAVAGQLYALLLSTRGLGGQLAY